MAQWKCNISTTWCTQNCWLTYLLSEKANQVHQRMSDSMIIDRVKYFGAPSECNKEDPSPEKLLCQGNSKEMIALSGQWTNQKVTKMAGSS